MANDPDLAKQFNLNNQNRMMEGKASITPLSEHVGKRKSFELDHLQAIGQGGDVYNIDNLSIKTPKISY